MIENEDDLAGKTIKSVYSLKLTEGTLLVFTDNTYALFVAKENGAEGPFVKLDKNINPWELLQANVIDQSKYDELSNEINLKMQDELRTKEIAQGKMLLEKYGDEILSK